MGWESPSVVPTPRTACPSWPLSAKEAGEANDNGDEYDLAVTILTAVLFFAGISVVISDSRISWGLLVITTLLLIGATAFVVSLHLA